MNQENVSLITIITSVFSLLMKILVVLLLVVAIAFIFIDKQGSPFLDNVRNIARNISVPIMEFFSSSDDNVESPNIFDVYDENKALKAEVEQLRRMKQVMYELVAENQRLRKMMGYTKLAGNNYKVARAIGSVISDYGSSMIINTGSANGIEVGKVVINQDGLIGRISSVSEDSAYITVITAADSRVPVMTQLGGEKAIMTGINGDKPKLEYLSNYSNLQEGDVIVTSGDGGIFPRSIPVGKVSIGVDGKYYVKPFIDWYRVNRVFIPDGNEIDFKVFLR